MHSVLQAVLAQTAPESAQSAPSMLANPLFMMVAIGAVFYFIIFRPQQKQAKQHQSFLGALKKGDEVVTQGGIVGTVVLVEDRTVTVDVGGGTKIRVVKNQIAGQWKPVETPAKAEAKK